MSDENAAALKVQNLQRKKEARKAVDARRALKATCVRLLELFAEGEEPPHDRRCLACGAETTSRCARCKVVFFCNNDRKCLAAVWAEHKGHCVAAKTP